MNPIVRSTATTLCVSLFGGLLASCAPRIDLAAERAAIQTVDSQMVSALNGRDLERWLSFLADDASMLPPNAPAVTGKSAIRTLLSELMAIPNGSWKLLIDMWSSDEPPASDPGGRI